MQDLEFKIVDVKEAPAKPPVLTEPTDAMRRLLRNLREGQAAIVKMGPCPKGITPHTKGDLRYSRARTRVLKVAQRTGIKVEMYRTGPDEYVIKHIGGTR
jgi:hypothetical protein